MRKKLWMICAFLKEFGGILGDIKAQEKQQTVETTKSLPLPTQEESVQPVETLEKIKLSLIH